MNKNSSTPVYDESKIKLSVPSNISVSRTGMYIGRLGDGSNPDDGIYVLLKEIIDNAIDEYIMGFGKNRDQYKRRYRKYPRFRAGNSAG